MSIANTKSEVAENYIAAISKSNFKKAAEYVNPKELSELHTMFKGIVSANDEVVLSVIGLEGLSQEELNSFSKIDVYAHFAEDMLSKQDKANGHYENRQLIGIIEESESFAHAVIRDKSGDFNSMSITLIRKDKDWYVKVPTAMMGLLKLHLMYSQS